MNATKLLLVLLATIMSLGLVSSSSSRSLQARPKILCLHGGDMSASAMRQQLSSLMAALPDFEFVFATGAYGNPPNNALWMPDPTGGKGQPTTDPAVAQLSVAALNHIVATQGPFYGILGYSQGAAFVTPYLAQVPVGTFSIAVMFCGYLPETHSGLMSTINARASFGDIPALLWMGTRDPIISNGMTRAAATKYTSPVIVSDNQGHIVPTSSAATFGRVVAFIETHRATSPVATPSTSPPTSPVTSLPTLPPTSPISGKPTTSITSESSDKDEGNDDKDGYNSDGKEKTSSDAGKGGSGGDKDYADKDGYYSGKDRTAGDAGKGSHGDKDGHHAGKETDNFGKGGHNAKDGGKEVTSSATQKGDGGDDDGHYSGKEIVSSDSESEIKPSKPKPKVKAQSRHFIAHAGEDETMAALEDADDGGNFFTTNIAIIAACGSAAVAIVAIVALRRSQRNAKTKAPKTEDNSLAEFSVNGLHASGSLPSPPIREPLPLNGQEEYV